MKELTESTFVHFIPHGGTPLWSCKMLSPSKNKANYRTPVYIENEGELLILPMWFLQKQMAQRVCNMHCSMTLCVLYTS